MSVNEDRLLSLVAAYGADSQRWPAAERDDALALLAANPALQQAVHGHVQLDRWLDVMEPPDFDALESRLLRMSLPARQPSALDRVLAWLLPPSTSATLPWFRVALLGSVVFAGGIAAGSSYDSVLSDANRLSVEQELHLLALGDLAEEIL